MKVQNMMKQYDDDGFFAFAFKINFRKLNNIAYWQNYNKIIIINHVIRH